MALLTLLSTRWARRLVIFALVFALASLWRLWQPERQVELHHRHLLEAVADKKLRRVHGFLAENYSDPFGHTRETLTTKLGEVLRHFFALTVTPQGTQMGFLSGNSAVITQNLTITGTGAGAVELITREVNGLSLPWIFYWRQQSWLPWDWKLEKVENASLTIPSF